MTTVGDREIPARQCTSTRPDDSRTESDSDSTSHTERHCQNVNTGTSVGTSVQGGQKKRGHRLITVILTNLNRFLINFFTVRFLGKFAVKWILKIPLQLAYVATLPCETLMSAKQAINDKLQGSVATYLRCSGVVITKLRTIYC